MRKLAPCRWAFSPGLDPKEKRGISASFNIFADRWWCNEHRCGLEYPRGTAPKTAPTAWEGWGNVAECCKQEVAEREKRERTAKWRWRWWYLRTLPKRILDVLRGSDTGGEDY